MSVDSQALDSYPKVGALEDNYLFLLRLSRYDSAANINMRGNPLVSAIYHFLHWSVPYAFIALINGSLIIQNNEFDVLAVAYGFFALVLNEAIVAMVRPVLHLPSL